MSPYPLLELEKTADPHGEYITLAVRMKLDLAALKIRLDDWQSLADPVRHRLHEIDAESPAGVERFAALLRAALEAAGARPPESLPASRRATVRAWDAGAPIPGEVHQRLRQAGLDPAIWDRASRFTRYVLCSFAAKRDGRDFDMALTSLGLLPDASARHTARHSGPDAS